MPVIETRPHPKTVMAANKPQHCKNRKMSPGYFAKDREYLPNGHFVEVTVFVKHAMSTTCRYDKSLTDDGCKTCDQRGLGEKYFAEVNEKGN